MNKCTDLPGNQPRSPSPSRLARFWATWLRPLVLVAIAVFAFRSAIFDWNVVPTGSMKPTILEGDYILVNKLAYDLRVPFLGWRIMQGPEPKRGEIVIFEPPGESERYVKRIIGIPGDVIEMNDNRLFVNGKSTENNDRAAPRPIPNHVRVTMLPGRAVSAATQPCPDTTFGPVVVPPGSYFVLGDNRCNSKDSRSFGFVPRDRLLGRAVRVIVSLDPKKHGQARADRFLIPLV